MEAQTITSSVVAHSAMWVDLRQTIYCKRFTVTNHQNEILKKHDILLTDCILEMDANIYRIMMTSKQKRNASD